MDPLLRAEEVTRLLGVSRSWFERLMASGDGPQCFKVGRMRRWRRPDVLRWIDARMDTSREETARVSTAERTVRKENAMTAD
ncbi:MAG: helix-turn-helix transcriptional regulator [Panacagrimonas sp.]